MRDEITFDSISTGVGASPGELRSTLPPGSGPGFRAEGLNERLKAVRLMVFDVDGTLTDGRITYFEVPPGTAIGAPCGATSEVFHGTIANGRGALEAKSFHVTDGLAIKIAGILGYRVALVTGRKSPIVEARAAELGITLLRQGVWDKAAEMRSLLIETGFTKSQCLFMGDDIIDLPGMGECGVSVAPADAEAEVAAAVDWITRRPGGRGAAREVITGVLDAQGRSLKEAFGGRGR